jgi:hypothetical protein
MSTLTEGLTRGQAQVARKLVKEGIPEKLARDIVMSGGYTMRRYTQALHWAQMSMMPDSFNLFAFVNI